MSEPAKNGRVESRIILVVGARRSGTNWVARIIHSHPDVAALPNETYLFHALHQLEDRFQHGSRSSWQLATTFVERDVLIRGMRGLVDSVLSTHIDLSDPNARLLERTPDHVRSLELIAEIYPRAHVVNIVRDGRDVVRSLVSMDWGPDDVEEAALEWASAVTLGTGGPTGLANLHQVRYEDLYRDTTTQIWHLYEQLGLQVDDEIIDRARMEAAAPFNHDPRDGSIALEKWRTALTPEQIGTIERVAGGLLAEHGYRLSGETAVRSRRPRFQRRRSKPAPENPVGPVPMNALQRIVDDFLAAVRSGDVRSAESMFDEHALFRLTVGDELEEGRGMEARSRFLDAVMRDETFRYSDRHDVHPSEGSFTVVATAPGSTPAVLVFGFEHRRVIRATWHGRASAE